MPCILSEQQNTMRNFKGNYTINLEVTDNKLIFKSSEFNPEILLKSTIDRTIWGGFGILYNGGSPTMINEIKAVWK